MKFLLFFIPWFLYALDIYNGQSKIIELKNDVKKVYFNKKELPILELNGKRFVLIRAGYKDKKDIKLILKYPKKEEEISLHVKQRRYKKEYIKVASSKVTPNKRVLKRVSKEYKEAHKIYSTITKKQYYSKPFILPINSKITSEYGNARVFNKVLKSFHSGVDFRAKIGTPIKAVNDGVVVIAKNRYYAGGSVVIDHGGGVYSCYYHLSKILKRVGDKIKQGDIVGLSGKTGRVNGPHLHFSIMLYDRAVDPLNFIKEFKSL